MYAGCKKCCMNRDKTNRDQLILPVAVEFNRTVQILISSHEVLALLKVASVTGSSNCDPTPSIPYLAAV
jgi:hypothetical protein